MTQRRRHLKVATLVATSLWITATILTNLAAVNTRTRLDFTYNQRHLISAEGESLLRASEEPITVRAFLPSSLPAPYGDIVRTIRSGLQSYKASSDVPFDIKFVDPLETELSPKERENLNEQAKAYGLKKTEIQTIQADQRVRLSVYLGIVVTRGSRQAVAPPIYRADQFEYAFATTLQRVTLGRSKKQVIALGQNHGEPDIFSSPLRTELEQYGDLEKIDIDGKPIPAHIDVLVLLGSRRPFSRAEQYSIDQFLMRGKSLVLCLDYRPISNVYPNLLVNALTGLESMLSAYGAIIDAKRTLVDTQNPKPAPVQRDRSGRVIFAAHPLYTQMVTPDTDHPAIAGLETLIVPVASPIKLEASDDRVQRTSLYVSEKTAKATTDATRSGPDYYQTIKDLQPLPEPVSVVAALEGTLRSAFKAEDKPITSSGSNQQFPSFLATAQGDARIVLATSGTRMLAASENGLRFLRNAVAWAAVDARLSGIRARTTTDKNLYPTTSSERFSVRLVAVASPVLVLIVIGLFNLKRRRRV
ncbi:MAG: Gldg family protein [Bradymonadia bacterium]